MFSITLIIIRFSFVFLCLGGTEGGKSGAAGFPKGAQPVSGFDSFQMTVLFRSRFSHPKYPNKSIILTSYL